MNNFCENILYQDQAELMAKTRKAMVLHKTNLIRAETGSGKTIIASAMVAASQKKHVRSIFVVPRRELLKQTSQTYNKFQIPHSFVASGRPYNPFAYSYVATARTLLNRIRAGVAPKASVIFLDEVHYSFDESLEIANHYMAQGAWIIGLTATPIRSDNKGLGRLFDNMIEGPSMRWLIDNRRLSDYRMFQPAIPDLSMIKMVAGDYAKGQIDDRMRADRVLIKGAVEHYRKRAMGMLNKVYCTSIAHSEQVAYEFRLAGIPAAHISGKTPDNELIKIIQAFARREILALASCDLCTFGFDLSAASGYDVTIECMTDLQPTLSIAKQRQKYGRVLRYKDFPALIFDNAGNSFRVDGQRKHGYPDDEISWSLADGEVKKSNGTKAPPSRQCPECYAVFPPAPKCPDCGFIFEVKGREVEEVEGELVEMTREQREEMRRKESLSRRAEQGRAQTLEDLIRVGRSRGMKYPAHWAARVMAARMRKNG